MDAKVSPATMFKESGVKALLAAGEILDRLPALGMEAAAEATKPLEQKEGQLKEDTEKFAKDRPSSSSC